VEDNCRYRISTWGHLKRSGPPAWGLGEEITTPHYTSISDKVKYRDSDLDKSSKDTKVQNGQRFK